jgi:hypothetical protein
MLRLLADENFNADIVRALLFPYRTSTFIRVQDVGLAGADDPDILAWAAAMIELLLRTTVRP